MNIIKKSRKDDSIHVRIFSELISFMFDKFTNNRVPILIRTYKTCKGGIFLH